MRGCPATFRTPPGWSPRRRTFLCRRTILTSIPPLYPSFSHTTLQQHAYRRGAAGARRDLIAAKKVGDGPAALTEDQKQEIRCACEGAG